MGGACEKKSPKAGDTGAINAMDRSGSGGSSATSRGRSRRYDAAATASIPPSSATRQAELFYKLVGSLQSPCGKADSLRTSFTTDTSCKRAPFAVRYVIALLEDEATEAAGPRGVREQVQADRRQGEARRLEGAARGRAPTRRCKLVEFFDYGCPHCAAFKPMIEQVLADEQGKVVIYFMMFPLEKHPDSKSRGAGRARRERAGQVQGDARPAVRRSRPSTITTHVTEYAKELGLDMAKFETDYNAFARPGRRRPDAGRGRRCGLARPPCSSTTASTTGPCIPSTSRCGSTKSSQ